MSRLQDLINRHCPNGVPFKPLGEVCEIKRGVRVTRDDLDEMNNGYPVFQNSLIPLGYFARWNCRPYTVFIIGAGAAGDIGFSDNEFWAADDCYYIENNDKVDSKFAYYFLTNCQYLLKSKVRKASVPRISRDIIKQILIPVPPIEVQEEIVRILDMFSNYAAELQAELQARKEQYEYYRNFLLTFNPSACGFGTDDKQENDVTTWGGVSSLLSGCYKIKWEKLMDICNNICSGGTPYTSNKSYYMGNIPWLRTQEVDWKPIYDTEIKISKDALSKSSAKIIPKNCVIVAMYGATAAKCCINKIPLSTNQACCNLEINPKIADYKYVYQFICNEYRKLKNMGEGSQSNISSSKIKNYIIPIPPPEVQEKIVSILDRFETLVNDLSQGLPAEIAAVKEQYEYYRNKLLTFKKIA